MLESTRKGVVSEEADEPEDREETSNTAKHEEQNPESVLVAGNKNLDVHNNDQRSKHKLTVDFKFAELLNSIRASIKSVERKQHKKSSLPACVEEPTPESRLVKENIF
jgi:hypothetical protein